MTQQFYEGYVFEVHLFQWYNTDVTVRFPALSLSLSVALHLTKKKGGNQEEERFPILLSQLFKI